MPKIANLANYIKPTFCNYTSIRTLKNLIPFLIQYIHVHVYVSDLFYYVVLRIFLCGAIHTINRVVRSDRQCEQY